MCFAWFNEKLKKYTCVDYGVMKVCVFAFALLVAKMWPAVLSLPVVVYAGVFVLTYIYLIWNFFATK